VYTAFCLVLVPFYWAAYGPTNFLYFCDLALFFTLAAVWAENALLASMPAVGILVPQVIWVVDFIGTSFGQPLTGMTAYMFKESIPLFARMLSSFHGWLPFLLVFLVCRLGYDRRALAAWTVLAWGLLLICFLILPAPPAPADNPNLPVNVNYVYGPGDKKPQEWMSPWQWMGVMMAGLPLLCFLPAHLALIWLSRWQAGARNGSRASSP
jgi:hypothetical protein